MCVSKVHKCIAYFSERKLWDCTFRPSARLSHYLFIIIFKLCQARGVQEKRVVYGSVRENQLFLVWTFHTTWEPRKKSIPHFPPEVSLLEQTPFVRSSPTSLSLLSLSLSTYGSWSGDWRREEVAELIHRVETLHSIHNLLSSATVLCTKHFTLLILLLLLPI